jgi:hypothetical protein
MPQKRPWRARHAALSWGVANNRPVPKTLTATGWLRAMEPGKESGGSEPHLFATDDGSYMVKTCNNPQLPGAPRLLVNELVGGLCLDWLEVKHPECAVIDVPSEVIQDSPGAKFSNGTPVGAGKGFGSKHWQSDPGGTVGVELLVKTAVAGTMAFDTWIRPGDSRQYRVRKSTDNPGKYDFIPVDQGHSIGPAWTADSLNGDRAIALAPPVAPVVAADVTVFIDRLRQFKEDDGKHIVSQVPPDWLAEADREALIGYLVVRAGAAADALAGQYPTGEPVP